MRLLTPVLALALVGCEAATDASADEALGRLLAEDEARATVVREYFSGITEPATLLVTSNEQWARVWHAIYANRSPAPDRPAVDFSREGLLLHALGTSNGISNRIENVRVFERGVALRVVLERYSERCLILAAMGQPVHVVRIARPAGRVVRVESRESVIACE